MVLQTEDSDAAAEELGPQDTSPGSRHRYTRNELEAIRAGCVQAPAELGDVVELVRGAPGTRSSSAAQSNGKDADPVEDEAEDLTEASGGFKGPATPPRAVPTWGSGKLPAAPQDDGPRNAALSLLDGRPGRVLSGATPAGHSLPGEPRTSLLAPNGRSSSGAAEAPTQPAPPPGWPARRAQSSSDQVWRRGPAADVPAPRPAPPRHSATLPQRTRSPPGPWKARGLEAPMPPGADGPDGWDMPLESEDFDFTKVAGASDDFEAARQAARRQWMTEAPPAEAPAVVADDFLHLLEAVDDPGSGAAQDGGAGASKADVLGSLFGGMSVASDAALEGDAPPPALSGGSRPPGLFGLPDDLSEGAPAEAGAAGAPSTMPLDSAFETARTRTHTHHSATTDASADPVVQMGGGGSLMEERSRSPHTARSASEATRPVHPIMARMQQIWSQPLEDEGAQSPHTLATAASAHAALQAPRTTPGYDAPEQQGSDGAQHHSPVPAQVASAALGGSHDGRETSDERAMTILRQLLDGGGQNSKEIAALMGSVVPHHQQQQGHAAHLQSLSMQQSQLAAGQRAGYAQGLHGQGTQPPAGFAQQHDAHAALAALAESYPRAAFERDGGQAKQQHAQSYGGAFRGALEHPGGHRGAASAQAGAGGAYGAGAQGFNISPASMQLLQRLHYGQLQGQRYQQPQARPQQMGVSAQLQSQQQPQRMHNSALEQAGALLRRQQQTLDHQDRLARLQQQQQQQPQQPQPMYQGAANITGPQQQSVQQSLLQYLKQQQQQEQHTSAANAQYGGRAHEQHVSASILLQQLQQNPYGGGQAYAASQNAQGYRGYPAAPTGGSNGWDYSSQSGYRPAASSGLQHHQQLRQQQQLHQQQQQQQHQHQQQQQRHAHADMLALQQRLRAGAVNTDAYQQAPAVQGTRGGAQRTFAPQHYESALSALHTHPQAPIAARPVQYAAQQKPTASQYGAAFGAPRDAQAMWGAPGAADGLQGPSQARSAELLQTSAHKHMQ